MGMTTAREIRRRVGFAGGMVAAAWPSTWLGETAVPLTAGLFPGRFSTFELPPGPARPDLPRFRLSLLLDSDRLSGIEAVLATRHDQLTGFQTAGDFGMRAVGQPGLDD